MLDALRKRLEKDEEGFTLIELMVVVLIIGILVAIAVPTFLNAQNNAKSKAAQSNARSSLSAAKTLHAEQEAYLIGTPTADGPQTLAALQAAEPSLDWVATMGDPSVNVDDISWTATTVQFTIAVRAKNNDCFYIRDNVDPTSGNPGTYFGKTVNTTAATCDSNGAGPNWAQSQTLGWPKTGASL